MKIDIDTTGIDNFAKRLKDRADGLRKNVYATLNNWGSDVQIQARQVHKFQTISGALERSVSKKMRNEKNPRVYLYLDRSLANYGKFIHEGTKDHEIAPKTKKALRFVGGDGFYFTKGHKVKGIKADPFLKNAIEKKMPDLKTSLELAIRKT